jgi:hypothetical protein
VCVCVSVCYHLLLRRNLRFDGLELLLAPIQEARTSVKRDLV